MLTVSRRGFLLAKPSAAVMRAAGRAASDEARRSVGGKILRRQLDGIAHKYVPRTTDISLTPMRLPYLSEKGAQRLGLKPGEYVPSLVIPA